MSMRAKFLLGMFLTISLLPLEARAHFCDDLWAGSYDLVVRPETDTVTLPASGVLGSGTATMNITVQNNTGFALINFALTAKIGTTAITATRQAGKIAGTTLHPGERAQYALAVTGTAGGSVKIQDISFFVKFGNSSETQCYPTKGAQPVMVKTKAGTLYPTGTPAGLATAVDPGSVNGPGTCTGEMDQSRAMQYGPQADYINIDTGLNSLMTYYCAGRGSWDSGSDAIIAGACTGTAIDCTKATRSLSAGAGTKYDYAHLWGALELAVRKSALGATRLATLRLGLQCGAGDANTGFAGFAMMMLGYLGDDATAHTFLVGKAGGTGDLATIAKAALLLMGEAADKTTYEAAVTAGLTGDTFVSTACAAALGIVENDDAHVTSVIVSAAKWNEPDSSSENGQGFYAAHLLALVAGDRRGWAASAGDTGTVSFYESGTAPGGTPGTGGSVGSGGSTGAGGAAGTGGIVATGGKATTASGGSAGTATSGTTSAGGIIATGGKTVTAASGGSAGTATGGTASAGGIIATGGKSGTASGGRTGTPSGGSITTGGSTGTLTGGTTGSGTGGSTSSGTGGSASGGKEAGTGGGTGAGAGGQNGSGGSSGSVSANSGSAGGCGYAGRAPISLGFLLAGVGLVLALRRRRR